MYRSSGLPNLRILPFVVCGGRNYITTPLLTPHVEKKKMKKERKKEKKKKKKLTKPNLTQPTIMKIRHRDTK